MLPARLIKPLFFATLCTSLLGCTHGPQEVQTEQLLKTSHSWDGTAYETYPGSTPELTILKITIPANTTLKWHTHPMPNVAYVLSGELMVETRSGHQTRLKPGEVLPELVNIPHRGTSGNSPVELIVFYAGAPGLPLSKPD